MVRLISTAVALALAAGACGYPPGSQGTQSDRNREPVRVALDPFVGIIEADKIPVEATLSVSETAADCTLVRSGRAFAVGQGLIQASVQAFGQIVETVETTHAPPESLTNDVVIVPEIDVFDLFYWSGASDGGARDEVRAVARVRTRTSIWTNGERIWRDVYEAPREYSDPFSRTVREDVRHAADVVSRALSACVRHAAQECARNETLRSRLVEAQLASTGQLYRSAPNTRRGSHARTVAVLGLRGLVVSDDEAMILTDRLRVELARVSGFRLVEREQLERILEEQGLQTSGICDTEECIVEIGRLLGAGYVVTGAVGRLGQTYTVSARMVDVETGQVVKHAAEDCTCQIDGMLRSIRAIAEALSRP